MQACMCTCMGAALIPDASDAAQVLGDVTKVVSHDNASFLMD